MSSHYNTDFLRLAPLQEYCIFIRNNKLDDFVTAYIANIHSSNVPLLSYFSHITPQHLETSARHGIVKLLIGIEGGAAIDYVRQTLADWKNNGISGIPREVISLKDITLIYSAQKTSFQSFIPNYTTDVAVALSIINDIDEYYKQVQELTLQMYEVIQQEEQEKRQESENKYRDLFDNASDLIQIVAPDNTLIYVNNSWLATLGYTDAETKGRQISDFIEQSEKDKFKSNCVEMIDGKTFTKNIKTCFKKKTGEDVFVEGTVNCKVKNGKAEYTRGIFHDITEKTNQEKRINFYINQLAEKEENLRTIIENAPDGIIVIDKHSRILLWNPKAESIFGWTKEQVTGRLMFEIIMPHRNRQAHIGGIEHYFETKQAPILNKTIEVSALHKKGHEFYISLTVSHSTEGGKDVFIAFLRDVTDQKKNELELENKRKQLEKSNEELQQYAWLTSHDLKEPLRKILTFSDALIKRHDNGLSEQSFTYLNKIQSAANRMNDLIEAVLLYSNVIDDDRLFEPTDLNTIIYDVIDDLEILITSKNAVINHAGLPVIKAIPVQMRQLFLNLISNALKYSKKHEAPQVNISYKRETEGHTFLVKDNGIGFEEAYSGKIFEVFQRLQKNKEYEGTGIGLALCKKIAEAHKGTIHAESELGVGSSFIVHLPHL